MFVLANIVVALVGLLHADRNVCGHRICHSGAF